MTKVLVTGGAGFIGSHIAEALINKNYEVSVFDNLYTGKEQNISGIRKDIDFVKGDICDYELLLEKTKGIDYIFHEAALRNVRVSVKYPHEYNKTNITGTLNLLNAANENNVKRVIFASSSSVYGDSKKFPFNENQNPMPASPYAITKITGEYYLKLFYSLYGLETISLRYFTVYGPRQDPKSQYATMIPIFIDKISNNQNPEIFGDGKQSRDFTYVEDIINGNLAAMKASKKACGEVFNIAAGNPISVNYVFKKINEYLGKNIKAKYGQKKLGDILKTQADPIKAKKILGFKCKVPFDVGLKKTVEWFKSHSEYLGA